MAAPVRIVDPSTGAVGWTTEEIFASYWSPQGWVRGEELPPGSPPPAGAVVSSAPFVLVQGPPGPPGESGNVAEMTALLAGHVADETPHAAYDDIPTLRLLFENGLV